MHACMCVYKINWLFNVIIKIDSIHSSLEFPYDPHHVLVMFLQHKVDSS